MFTSPHPPRRVSRQLEPPIVQPRRWRAPEDDDVGWWPITFSDLVLLLLCFFVLWHVAEMRRAKSVLQEAAAAQPKAAPLQTSAPRPDLTPSAESKQTSALTEQPPPSVQAEQPAPPDPAEWQELQAGAYSPKRHPETAPPDPAEWQELQARLHQYVQEAGLERVVGVVSTEHGLVISLSDTITFPSGQATLSSLVTPLLSRVATLAVERADLDIEIAGHTDDRPIATATFPSNWELSAARASRVARALLEQGNIDPMRISTRGYAHYRPLQANDSEEHRAANRRVEVRFFRRVEGLG